MVTSLLRTVLSSFSWIYFLDMMNLSLKTIKYKLIYSSVTSTPRTPQPTQSKLPIEQSLRIANLGSRPKHANQYIKAGDDH